MIFHINVLQRGTSQKEKPVLARVRVPAAAATLASIRDNSGLALAPGPSAVSEMHVWPVRRTGALVTQGHSCETSLIPVLGVFGDSPSLAQTYLFWLFVGRTGVQGFLSRIRPALCQSAQ